MFREMRRKLQLLDEKESIALLERGTAGVLALSGDEGYPYAVPISYVYNDSKIFFHSAVSGHKIDAIKNSDKASFCVIAQDHIVPKEYTTYYKSVIAFGRLRILEDASEKEPPSNCWPKNIIPPIPGRDAPTPSMKPGPACACWNST